MKQAERLCNIKPKINSLYAKYYLKFTIITNYAYNILFIIVTVFYIYFSQRKNAMTMHGVLFAIRDFVKLQLKSHNQTLKFLT